jgi:serine/threonine-protein kinase
MGEPFIITGNRGSPTLAAKIDEACDRFEKAWRSGHRPHIEEALDAEPGALRSELLGHLVAVELAYRRGAGEMPTPEEYYARFPEFNETIALAFQRLAGDGVITARTPDVEITTHGSSPLIPEPKVTDRLRGEVTKGYISAPSDGSPARSFGDYELLSVLGRGGMGIVYEARQISLNRSVALKMIRGSAFASDDDLRRFRNEAEAVAILDHPHIVPIHEVGEHDGQPYFSMKLIRGVSLDRRMNTYRNDFRGVARLVETLAQAVHHAHQRGILHRDLKPANILVSDRGVPHIADFGLAKRIDLESDLTQSGAVLGTPGYMAPEQASGKRGSLTTATDVYGLGAILYALLTGRGPFAGDSVVEALQKVRDQAPEPPRKLNAKIPRDLETICLKAMAKDPRDRFASAHDLADELRRFAEGRTIRSRRIPSHERLWQWCKRSPWLAAACATTAAIVVTVAVVSMIVAESFRRQRDLLNDQLGRTQQAERSERIALGKSLLAEGAAMQRSGLIGQRFQSLERLSRAANLFRQSPEGMNLLPQIREYAITAMTLTDFRPMWQRDVGDVMNFMSDAEHEIYAVAEKHTGTVFVRQFEHDRELFRLPKPPVDFRFVHLAISRNGRHLLADYERRDGSRLLQIWEIGRNEKVFQKDTHSGAWNFHPDGRRLWHWIPSDSLLTIWDMLEDREIGRLHLDPRLKNGPYLDRDWTKAAFSTNETDQPLAKLYEVKSGKQVAIIEGEVGRFDGSLSADGRLLATGDPDQRTYVWDVKRRRLLSVLQGHTHSVLSAQFEPDGHLLATNSWDGTTRLWDAVTGESLVTAPALSMYFGLGGQRLGFRVGSTYGAWEIADGRECRLLHPGLIGNRTTIAKGPHKDFVAGGSFSLDGRLVANAGITGFWLWEVATGRELAHVEAGRTTSILFHPDGRSVVSSGERGVFRWPIAQKPGGEPGALRLGPPELISDSNRGFDKYPMTWLPGHQAVSFADPSQARVLVHSLEGRHPAYVPASVFPAGQNRHITSISYSPDGRWAAAGGWKEAGILVWDVLSARLVRVLRPAHITTGEWITHVAFSPDGQRLVATSGLPDSGGYESWSVKSWELLPSLPAEWPFQYERPPIFTADGRIMAVSIGPRQILLADALSGHEIVRLTTLDRVTPAPLAFSSDGTKLLAETNRKTALIWDLRRIREQLVAMGLDWDWPPFPPRSTSGEAAATLSVEVVGEVLEPTARRAVERKVMDARIDRDPGDADAWAYRGWLSSREQRWADAVADLRRAAQLRPRDVSVFRSLTAVLFEVPGGGGEAVDTLTRILEIERGDTEARLNRGLLRLVHGDASGAEADFSHLLELVPSHLGARYHRIRARHRLGRYLDTLVDLDGLIVASPRIAINYHLRGKAREATGDVEGARGDFRKADELLPKNPIELNNAAWELVAGPEMTRDPEQAMLLIRKGVDLGSGNQSHLNTLGVVQFRLGLNSEAIDTLNESLRLGRGQLDSFDLFFLAMAHARLGHMGEARDCYDRALRWWEGRKDLPDQYNRELMGFRVEAELVLADAFFPMDPFVPGPLP